jgi:hypothetical protein
MKSTHQVMRIVEEHYLRDDLGLGSLHGLTTLGSPHELLALLEQHAVEEKGAFSCIYMYGRGGASRLTGSCLPACVAACMFFGGPGADIHVYMYHHPPPHRQERTAAGGDRHEHHPRAAGLPGERRGEIKVLWYGFMYVYDIHEHHTLCPPYPPNHLSYNTHPHHTQQAAGKVMGVCVVPQTVLEETRANSLAAYRYAVYII